jgi:hypothetical protein
VVLSTSLLWWTVVDATWRIVADVATGLLQFFSVDTFCGTVFFSVSSFLFLLLLLQNFCCCCCCCSFAVAFVAVL